MSNDIFSQIQSGQAGNQKFKRVAEPGESSPMAIALTIGVVAIVGAATVPQIRGAMVQNEAANQSQEALFRAQQNAYRGVNNNRQEVAFHEGMSVFDASTMKPITQEGAFVVNKRGDTAVIKNGVLADIKRVSSADAQAYLETIQRNEVLRTRPGV